ncbi:hypothetical protein CC2G_006004 [Coprinopsis cinerea AmutBmut pab1-1]|nr:hypothetical protein CC2G_006004 [Coprinopsis cinerea AmutBmut pab1-1]
MDPPAAVCAPSFSTSESESANDCCEDDRPWQSAESSYAFQPTQPGARQPGSKSNRVFETHPLVDPRPSRRF